ncbi:MAG: polynucleotide adenylyltransferase PcnB [Bdellovibrionales bacterium]|nr:polynucleotide adenylyltransferase PcnB [Bdellovibrionales bacterium]
MILSRDEHSLSRKKIDPDALKVLYRLHRSGYKAYLVGGGVRDLLLGKQPKDFDIGTDASPDTVRRLFRNSRIIGRRFKINHVYFKGNKIIEVTTFRAEVDSDEETEDVEPVVRDNQFGDDESDALRRDLTINGLFYDISDYSIIDYVGGIQDLNDGIIRIIGEPERRIREDPVRMIRAVRHAARTGFEIEPVTYNAIRDLAQQIELSSPARVHEEVIRDLTGCHAREAFKLFDKTGLLPYLTPIISEAIQRDPKNVWKCLDHTLAQIDKMSASVGPGSVGTYFAAMLVGVAGVEELRDRVPESLADEVAPFFVESAGELAQYAALPEPLEKLERASAPTLRGPVRRSSRKKVKKSDLRRTIDALYLPLQITRRERDVMEDALRMRFAMITATMSAEPDERQEALRVIRKSPLFSAGLKLLRLTARGENAELLDEWESVSADRQHKSAKDVKREKKKRTRRRRRRRKRSDRADSEE